MRKGQEVSSAWVNSPQADEVAEYYTQGHSVRETAEAFGVSKHQVNSLAKKRNLSNGRSFRSAGKENAEVLRRGAEDRLRKELELKGFEYLRGYTDKLGKVSIKCKCCGYEFERTVAFVKTGNLICRKCEHEKALVRQAAHREARIAENKKKAEERKIKREAEKIKKNPLGLSYYQLSRRKTLDEVSVCKVCGRNYTLREYMESIGTKYYRNSGYCSVECRDVHTKERIKISHKGRRDSHRYRAKKYGCEYDPSVTLEKLIERDGLRCKICGEMCDPDDYSWSEYTGPLSPSIDHIIPMAKGGGHIWNNVQVAHVICNSNKGDKLEEAM